MEKNSTEQNVGIVESPEKDPLTGFDFRTHISDKKTGKLIKYQPYLRMSDQKKGVVYERNGIFYDETGHEADESIWGKPSTKTMSRQVTANTVDELQAKLEEQQRKIDELMAQKARASGPQQSGQQNHKAG